MKTDHYKPTRAKDGTWEFTTPTGWAGGFFAEPDAKRIAERTEAQDRVSALNETGPLAGPLAGLLRNHFFPKEVAP